MKRSSTTTFVLTLLLMVKPGEDSNLIGRMEAGRRLTNATLGEALRRHGLLKQSNAWQAARMIRDKKGRGAAFQRLSTEAGFSPAALISFARIGKNEAGWKDRLGSNVVQRIAEQVFAAVQQVAFGQHGRPRFKGTNRPLHSLEATTNAANIIWKKETGCVVLGELTLPVLLPSAAQDPTVHQALARLASKTKYCRVLWRNVKGERRWFVPLLQTGIAPAQYPAAEGAVVGLDIGPSTIAVVGDGSASRVKFCDSVIHLWTETRRLQRKIERTLAAERQRAHGELANQMLGLGNVIHSETLSYRSFQKNFGKSVKVRVLECRAYLSNNCLARLKMSQYDHLTQTCTKKPLSQCWHGLGDRSGAVHRDIYSIFFARCVMNNVRHTSHTETIWAAQKPVRLQTEGLRHEPAKIEPYFGLLWLRSAPVAQDKQHKSGKITVLAPSKQVVCNKRRAIGHGQDAVVARREPRDPDGFAFRTPALAVGRFRIGGKNTVIPRADYGTLSVNQNAFAFMLLVGV
jgi:hypothetical protein